MQLLLGEGENIVSHWDYAEQKKLFGFKRTYSLTLTNKRLIHAETQKRGVTRRDFAVNEIKGVEVNNSRSLNMAYIICAVVLAVLAIVMFATLGSDTFGIILGILFLVLAIIFVIAAFGLGTFSVVIYMDASAMSLIGLSGKTSRWFRGRSVKLKVNVQACEEIAATISRTVLADPKF